MKPHNSAPLDAASCPVENDPNLPSLPQRFIAVIGAVGMASGILVNPGLGESIGMPDAEANTPSLRQASLPLTGLGIIDNSTPKPKCLPGQVELQVSPKATISSGVANFTIKATSCGSTLNNLKLLEVDSQPVRTRVQSLGLITSLQPGHDTVTPFSIKLPSPADSPNAVKPVQRDRILDFRAISSTGKQLGDNQTVFVYQWPSATSISGSFMPEQLAQLPCKPNPDFVVGVQQDKYSLWGTPEMRNAMLDRALADFPETKLVRLNVMDSDVRQHGLKQLKEAVTAIKKRGLDVAITIMRTPNYGNLPTKYPEDNYAKPNPEQMRLLAKNISSTLRGQVTYYDIENEPNESIFNKDASMGVFDAMSKAGGEGIKQGDPNAEIDAGEIDAGLSIDAYIKNVNNTVPNAAITIHPYAKYLYDLRQYSNMSSTPIKASEYALPANEPNHLAKLRAAVEVARCAGVKEFVLYGVFKDRTAGGWNTGWADPPVLKTSNTNTSKTRNIPLPRGRS